jgi:CRP-like cAMP-binding protein
MEVSHNPMLNQILAVLPSEIYQRLLPDLECIPLRLGQQIYAAGETLKYVYFPATAIVSLLYTMEDGRSAEIGIVGNDGVLGIAVFMGGESVPNRAVVQSGGIAFRMRADVLASEFRRTGILQSILLRYTQSLIAQMSQTAVCNRLHSVEQQLCRWLLLSHDRLASNELIMTQELIADMLGVRREAVSHEAARLQDSGLISYHRGHITILDRSGLEGRACECYGVVRREAERLMSLGSPKKDRCVEPSAQPRVAQRTKPKRGSA